MGCVAAKPVQPEPVQPSGDKAARGKRWGAAPAENERSSLYGRGELPPELADFELRAQAEELFIRADKDQDGRLNLAELREIMHRPEMAEIAMANYSKLRVEQSRLSRIGDERVALKEFLMEVKRSYDVSPKVAEKVLWIMNRTLEQRAAAAKEDALDAGAGEPAAAAEPAEPPQPTQEDLRMKNMQAAMAAAQQAASNGPTTPADGDAGDGPTEAAGEPPASAAAEEEAAPEQPTSGEAGDEGEAAEAAAEAPGPAEAAAAPGAPAAEAEAEAAGDADMSA